MQTDEHLIKKIFLAKVWNDWIKTSSKYNLSAIVAGNKILPACAQMQKKKEETQRNVVPVNIFLYEKGPYVVLLEKTLFLVSGVNIFCAKAAAQVIHAGFNKEFMTATSAGEVSAQYETGRLQKALN